MRIRRTLLTLAAMLAAPSVQAQEPWWTLRGQTTYVAQWKPAFSAAYSGPNSLRADRERSYSGTATIFLGASTWKGGEVYLNPELALGLPFSGLTGLGGFTNGELARVSGRSPTLYRARLFMRQTFDLGGAAEAIEEDENQVATRTTDRRLVFTFGNFSALDVFDDNAYAKDPRTQFLNWSLFAPGAWDYPADARGYTWGLAAEWITPVWRARAGRFAMPKISNGLELNARIFDSYGDVIEIERRHRIGEQDGRVSVLAFRNRARLGSFRVALANAEAAGDVPSLDTARSERSKLGAAISFDQRIAATVGVFGRYSWSDGRTETFAFTEIDRSASAGVVIEGARWGRTGDTFGLGLAKNTISTARKDYLAAGGRGFFLGDGALTYGGERIIETYYRVGLHRRASLTLDYQHIANPGYNKDRGPANVFGVRLHAVF